MPEVTKDNSSEKFDGIIVVVDQFSKQKILIPTRKNARTEEIYDPNLETKEELKKWKNFHINKK